jgi:hypothetical protein
MGTFSNLLQVVYCKLWELFSLSTQLEIQDIVSFLKTVISCDFLPWLISRPVSMEFPIATPPPERAVPYCAMGTEPYFKSAALFYILSRNLIGPHVTQFFLLFISQAPIILCFRRHCKAQPGLCEPYVDVIPLTPHCKYIILMTDGVYKSIEEPFQQKAGIDTNKVLMTTVNHESDQLVAQKRRFNVLADRVLGRIRAIHEDAYKNNAAQDVRSPVAVACRKRDDMTLLVHQFAI